jgi:endonuclease YncB( thermonuclease family)
MHAVRRWRAGVAGSVAALVVAVVLSGCEPVGQTTAAEPDHPPSEDTRLVTDGAEDADQAGAEARREKRRAKRERAAEKPSPAPTPTAAPKPVAAPKAPRTYLVTRVVDGDTLELANGETVRLAGIDTPERGECGYEEAAANLSRLVLGKRVRLGRSDEDRDRYGRLLRYVNVGTQDAGLRLIKNGLAIARYDSRDGYGYHPREPVYIAADRASKNFACPAVRPLVPAPAPGNGSCAPGYDPCVPPYPPDLDCADVTGPIRITGPDPHGFDRDGDGWGCE